MLNLSKTQTTAAQKTAPTSPFAETATATGKAALRQTKGRAYLRWEASSGPSGMKFGLKGFPVSNELR